MLILIVMAFMMRVQKKLSPYKYEILNLIEQREYMTSVLTFFCSLFFLDSNISDGVKNTMLVVVLLTNIWFFSLWIHIFLASYKLENSFAKKVLTLTRWLALVNKNDLDFEMTHDGKKARHEQTGLTMMVLNQKS